MVLTRRLGTSLGLAVLIALGGACSRTASVPVSDPGGPSPDVVDPDVVPGTDAAQDGALEAGAKDLADDGPDLDAPSDSEVAGPHDAGDEASGADLDTADGSGGDPAETPSDPGGDPGDVLGPSCGSAEDCAAAGAPGPCLAWACEQGVCLTVTVTNGTACDDGNGCTLDDRCASGKCVGTASPGCGCLKDADCAGFEDGNACNGTLSCLGGKCLVKASTVVTCPAALTTVCTWASCDPATGLCHAEPVTDGRPCSLDDPCRKAPACAGGFCVGTEVSCDDGNGCTTDGCIPGLGCASKAIEGPCDDGDPCTTGDACNGGACIGTPGSCDDHQPCTKDECVTGTGCVRTNVQDGTSCDDLNACTSGDACTHGACVGAAAVCTDGNVCTNDGCDPATGACVHTTRLAEPCDDSSPCTIADACQADGLCRGTPIPCDDGNPCTTDGCEDGKCSFADNTDACDDLNACTTADACTGGTCAGTAVVCGTPPKNSCKDPATMIAHALQGTCDGGTCTYATQEVFCANGCQDGLCAGDPCAGVDCSTGPGTCFKIPGTCRLGSCSFDFDDGKTCDDLNACTANDTCASGTCIGSQVTCTTPPGDQCLDPATRKAYRRQGTCLPATGACSYGFDVVSCRGGCLSGACLDGALLHDGDLLPAGWNGLGDGSVTGQCVMPGWAATPATASETYVMTVGFEP